MPKQSNFKSISLLSLSLIFQLLVTAQTPELPAELKPFILPGHEVLDFQSGDINKDQRPDAIMVLKNPLEDSTWEEFMPRPFLVLIRQTNGTLKQVIRNDKAIMGRHEGGVFGDPYQSLNLYSGGFSISFYGGSNWRWVYEYDFRWNALRKQWMLFHESSGSFNSTDMEHTMKETEIEAVELGLVPFEKFSYEGLHQQGKWKVIAAKTFFYDNPKIGSPRRKGYLVRGNIVESTRQLTNFIEVSFDNGKDITSGFILKKDLAPVK
jgi:hypothetical protein